MYHSFQKKLSSATIFNIDINKIIKCHDINDY